MICPVSNVALRRDVDCHVARLLAMTEVGRMARSYEFGLSDRRFNRDLSKNALGVGLLGLFLLEAFDLASF
jgi:hypothetical protein